jgi:hypothetical protein
MTLAAKLWFTFVIVVAGIVLVVTLLALHVLGFWGSPSGESTDLAASLAGVTRTAGCTQQEGHDWWWCGTRYDSFDGFEGAYFRVTKDDDDCWVATRGRIGAARPRAASRRQVRFVSRGARVLRGCVGSGPTGNAVDGPGQIPRLVGG